MIVRVFIRICKILIAFVKIGKKSDFIVRFYLLHVNIASINRSNIYKAVSIITVILNQY